MHDVFISYATENEARAIKIKETLERSGFSCWFAPSSIRGSEDYTKEITRGIDEARAFLLLISDAAQNSDWVHQELGYAVEKNRINKMENKPIMPIFVFYLEDCKLKSEYFLVLQYMQSYMVKLGYEQQMKRFLTDLGEKLNVPVNITDVTPKPRPTRRPLLLAIAAVAAIAIAAVLLLGGGPRDGEYVIWNPDHATALTCDVIHDYYLAGENVLGRSDTLSSYSPKSVWTLDFDGDTFTIGRAGQLLGMRQGYNGIGLGGDHIYVQWELVDAGDGMYFIRNKDTGYYLEWFENKNNWCAHEKVTAENQDMFLLRIDPAE